MPRNKSRRYKQRCLRCGFEWYSYKKKPARCANLKGKCCSKYWNRPYERAEETTPEPIPLPERTPQDDLGPFEWQDYLKPKKKSEPIDLKGLQF